METLASHAILLPIDNIDTDRIIPARFLITTKTKGLGRHFFSDWMHGSSALTDARILVVGHNFGCGSSREHAVWALADFGIEAVVSTGFADIFHANALRNGLVPVVVGQDDHEGLVSELESAPEQEVVIDFETRRLSCGSIEVGFTAAVDTVKAEDRETPGGEELDALLHQADRISRHEAARPPRVDTTGGGR
jgi:3-isopropylmalate/(R)-2-methylmalate dehydratase small subunit